VRQKLPESDGTAQELVRKKREILPERHNRTAFPEEDTAKSLRQLHKFLENMDLFEASDEICAETDFVLPRTLFDRLSTQRGI